MSIKLIHDFKALKDRQTFNQFQGKYSKHVNAAEADTAALNHLLDQVRETDTPLSKALQELEHSISKASQEVEKHKIYDVNNKEAHELFMEAQKKLTDTELNLDKFLKGEVSVNGEAGVEVSVTPELRQSFTKASGSVEKCTTIMNSLFGMARVEGIKAAAQHNFDKVIGKTEASALERGFKGGAVVFAGAAIGDALFRSKGRDEEDRSKKSRAVELLTGVGIGATAVLSGHAR